MIAINSRPWCNMQPSIKCGDDVVKRVGPPNKGRANSSSDLLCAFQPKRATAPSFPLLFVSPVIVRPEKHQAGLP